MKKIKNSKKTLRRGLQSIWFCRGLISRCKSVACWRNILLAALRGGPAPRKDLRGGNGPPRFVSIFACRGGPGSAAPRGGGRHLKIDFVLCRHGPLRKYFRSVFSARTDHYGNIFEAFSLPARTFTKIFPKRFFCPRGPLRNIFEAFFRPDYGEATI